MRSDKNQLTITGRVMEIGETIEGQTVNGQWRKAHFVILTEEKYPKDVCIHVWNDTIIQLERIKEQDIVNVAVNLVSRKHDGRWYTEVQAWRIDVDFYAMWSKKEGAQ